MKKIFLSFFVFLFFNAVAQQPDWRIGFEYFELAPMAGTGVTNANHDTIMQRLSRVTSAQQSRGGINIDGINWKGMQPFSFSTINFTETDYWVQRLQANDFEMVFYLSPTAQWSQNGNADCYGSVLYSECAPDSTHWTEWENYVKACVDRYNGDGDGNDMPGLQKPVRFFVLPQEVCFAGNPGGDSLEPSSAGYWHDNIVNLIEVHRHTYNAMRQADPSGFCKLVASGSWFIDLFGDFPDYPNPTTYNLNGPVIQNRLLGANLSGGHYNEWYDSTKVLLQALNDTSNGRLCDYICWHPHSGWKATDQSMKFIKTYAPDLPIFIDDMWVAILPTFNGQFGHFDGYTHFIGGDSLERDFPNTAVSSYFTLQQNLDNHVQSTVDWYNAKTARESVKCFATVFGEGAERVSFTLSNDVDTANPFYSTSYPYRFTGMMERRSYGYREKPVYYTMKIVSDMLHDFTSVTRLNVSSNNYTRVYQFDRARGTRVYVAWSEAVPTTAAFPSTPNGEMVSWNVLSQTLNKTDIITQPNVTTPNVSAISSSSGQITIQLGHEPVFIEETSGNAIGETEKTSIAVYPNPTTDKAFVRLENVEAGWITITLYDISGRTAKKIRHRSSGGAQVFAIDGIDLENGIYTCVVASEKNRVTEKMVWMK